jgi:stringent starvation protein B
MTSQKPYLIRAIYEWLLDNNMTPHLLVNTSYDGVQVPREYIHDNKIVLNISDGAVQNFHTDNDWISFSARFSGKPMELFIPIIAVQSIYGKENNEGMSFPSDDTPSPKQPRQPLQSVKKERPGLKIVK